MNDVQKVWHIFNWILRNCEARADGDASERWLIRTVDKVRHRCKEDARKRSDARIWTVPTSEITESC